MAQVTLSRTIRAPADAVWATWDDFARIDRFNPNLSRSFLLEGSPGTGLGAERQCDLADGRNMLRERVVDYVPGRRMGVEIFDTTLPIENARATVTLTAKGPDRTEVVFHLAFEPSMGLLGRAMTPLLKIRLRRTLGRLLDGNRALLERGAPPGHVA